MWGALNKARQSGQVTETASGRTETNAPRPDLTMTFDPVELWPDPENCPEWPLMTEEQRRFNGHFSEGDAQKRLTNYSYHLNGNFKTYQPDAAERAKLRDQYFAPGPSAYPRLGIAMVPRQRGNNRMDMIVECAHIRGWLRKKDAERQRHEEEERQREKRNQQALYQSRLDARDKLKAVMAENEEGAKRHQARMEDETAFGRYHDARRGLSSTDFELRRAASAIGVEVPPEAET